MQRVQRFDVFPKFDRRFEEDARQRTVMGGVFSLVSLIIILLLTVSELRYYFSIEEHHEMFVDPLLGGNMHISINLTFYQVPCDLMTLDAMDAFGIYAKAEDVQHIVKVRVDSESLKPLGPAREVLNRQPTSSTTKTTTTSTGAPSGGSGAALEPTSTAQPPCPPCYGAEVVKGECCHTCEEVRQAYARRGWNFNVDDLSVEQCAAERFKAATEVAHMEGCNLHATFTVARVTGNLHFIPGRIFNMYGRRMHDLMGNAVDHLNLSHVIHSLEFGERFPGQLNPLEGLRQVRAAQKEANGRYSYFIKVLPTRYESASLLFGRGEVLESNQYSVTYHFTPKNSSIGLADPNHANKMMPGVFFTYDLSPIKIHVHASHPYPSMLHLLLQLCSICGGVFTVAGLVDAALFHGAREIRRRRKLM